MIAGWVWQGGVCSSRLVVLGCFQFSDGLKPVALKKFQSHQEHFDTFFFASFQVYFDGTFGKGFTIQTARSV